MTDLSADDTRPAPARRPRDPQMVNYLLLALCPLIFWMLRGDIGTLIAGIVLLALFAVAAHLIVSALEDEEIGVLHARGLPRKLTGSLMIGLGTFGLGLIQVGGLAIPFALALMGFALSVVAFGLDHDIRLRVPVRKGASKEFRTLLATAEQVLAAIPESVATVEDEPVLLQARAFRDTVLALLERYPDALEDATDELRHVLNEAAEATDVFVEDYLDEPEPRIRRRYMLLLKELASALEMCLREIAGDLPDPEAEDDLPADLRVA